MVAGAATEGKCKFVLNIGWEGSAYAHKNGLAKIFLLYPDGEAISHDKTPVKKSLNGGSFPFDWGQREAGEYISRVLLYTSRGKDGMTLGSRLYWEEKLLTLTC